MSDVGGTLRLFGSLQGGAAASANAGRVVNPPASLLQLGGEAQTGTVVGRTPQGQLLVKGDFGQIAVATAARFPVGTAVALLFRPHASGLFVTVLPRTLPEGGAPAQRVPAAAAPCIPSSAAASPGPMAPTGAATPSQPPGAAAPLPGRIVGRDGDDHLLVKGKGFGQIAVASPVRLAAGTPVLVQITGGSSGPVATLFAAPSEAGMQPQAGAQQQPASLRALAFGPLVGGSPSTGATTPHPSASLGTPAPLARVWPTLTALAEAFAAPENNGLTGLLPPGFPPKAGSRLALSLLRFLQAGEGRGLLDWLGPQAAAGLAASRQGPAPDRLLEADDELRWLAKDPPGDWRLILLPLLGEGPPEALRFYLKKRGRPAEGEAETPAHFLCDLSLSRLGAIQIEGLLRPARFDLALRSRRELAPALREEITEIFHLASEAGGLAGSLRFQAGDDWHPLPVPHPAGPQATLTV